MFYMFKRLVNSLNLTGKPENGGSLWGVEGIREVRNGNEIGGEDGEVVLTGRYLITFLSQKKRLNCLI